MLCVHKMFKDSDDFHAKLVKEVEKHKCLYDYTMKEHWNREITQAAWDKVAEEVGNTANNCRESWRKLRNTYRHYLKKPSSSATEKQCFLLHHMSFLKRFMKKESKKIKMESAPSKPTASKDKNQNIEDSKAHSSNAPNLTLESFNSMVNKTPQDSSTELPSKNKNPHNTCAESSESKTEDRYSSNKLFVLSLLEDLGEMEANNLRTFKHEVWKKIKNILLSQQTIPKPFDKVISLAEPKPISQSSNEVSSMATSLVAPQPIPQLSNEVSSMATSLVAPQPIPQSSNEVSSMATSLVAPQPIPQSSNEVSSMATSLVAPQPIPQSSNEVSSMATSLVAPQLIPQSSIPKPTTSSSIGLQQQSDSCIVISDDDEDIITRAANCKVEISF